MKHCRNSDAQHLDPLSLYVNLTLGAPFFYSRQSGGTIVSTALEKMLEIQRERYATADWNICTAGARCPWIRKCSPA